MAWLSGWSYRKKHDIDGSTAGAVTNYQIKIVCHYGSGTDSGEDVYLNGKCRSDFGDVRFTADDGETLLDYWMEDYVDSDYAVFWVEVPSIPADPDKATIYVYYGKSDATYAGSGDDTFLFFDDFEDGSLDTSKWALSDDYPSGSSVTEHDGMLDIYKRRYPYSVQDFPDPIAIEMRIKRDVDQACWAGVTRFDGNANPSDYYNPYNGIAYIMGKSDGPSQLRKYVDGSKTVLDDSGTIDWPENTWMRVTFKDGKNQYDSYYYVDGTLYAQTSDSTTYTSNKVSPGASDQYVGGHLYVDWFAVRKYVDPEPSHGTWYAEETPVITLELTETLSVTDFRPIFSTSKTFTETISVSDVLSKLVARTFTESVSLSDVVSALRVKVKELVETIGLSDVVVKFASIVRSETITVSDVLEKVKTMYREFVETIGLSDRISKLTSIIKSETLSLTDILEKRFVILKVLTETLGLSDTLARIRIRKTLARIKGVTRILNAIREKPAERELGR